MKYAVFKSIFLFLLLSSCMVLNAYAQKSSQWLQKDTSFSVTYQPSDNFESTAYRLEYPHQLGSYGGFSISGNFTALYRHTNGESGFPRDLFGAGYALTMNQKDVRFLIRARSHSDRPFNSFDEIEFDLTGLRRFYTKETSSWFAGLTFHSRRSFLRHIPLVALLYEYRREPWYILAGIPIADIRLDLEDDLRFALSYRPVINVSASLEHDISEALTVSAEYTIKQETFLLADRENSDETLFLEQMSAGFRISRAITPAMGIDAYIGYSFAGSLYSGEKFSDRDNRENIDDSVLFSLGVRHAF